MRDFAELMEPAARLLLGEPCERLSSARELRWGRKGSLSVDLTRGIWHDHAAEEGGGLLDLIHREAGTATAREAFEWLERAGLLPAREGLPALSRAEREAYARRQDAARLERARAADRAHAQAAARAARIWGEAKPADPGHAYLARKRVQPCGARQCGRALVLPVMDFDGRLSSLQFIGPDGRKLLLSGGAKRGRFIPVSAQRPHPLRLLVAEGFATAATLAEAEPLSVVLAGIDAANLEPVAVQARARWPGAEIVICADADPVGIRKGTAAARAARALLAVPEFPPGAEGSDFNDLARLAEGVAA